MSETFTRDPSPRIQYAGDGSRTTFEFDFPVLASDDLLVFVDALPATGYAITGLGDPDGGAITFVEPPAAGTTVTLLRRTEGIRETVFVDGGPFRAASINAELDRIMMLIQEDREEHNRALRGRPTEGPLDFCLPPGAERAGKVLGFDSSGQPMAFGLAELPTGSDASGVPVTPAGATTARVLGEHLAALVNVRDFGALGDGVSDDAAAFEAAIAAASARMSPVYVPASATAYVIGATLGLDGVAMIGEGPGSMLKLAMASGAGIELRGRGAGLRRLRLLGPGALTWPANAGEVDLAGVALDGVRVAGGAEEATLEAVAVAGCHTGLAIEGGMRAVTGSSFRFNRDGIAFRAGISGVVQVTDAELEACSRGIHVDAAAGLHGLALAGGRALHCGRAIDLVEPAGARRTALIGGFDFVGSLDVDLDTGARQSAALRGCRLDGGGRRSGTRIDLLDAAGAADAAGLVAETTRAARTQVAAVQLSGGTNLDLLQPGDLIVLAGDADDVDDLWTALKATRAGVVHEVSSQTTATAALELATAAGRPLIATGDTIRVVGRSGTAGVDSAGTLAATDDFVWIRAGDFARVFTANDPTASARIDLAGSDVELYRLPGRADEPASLAGVEFAGGALNGAFVRLHTFDIADDAAVSFAPQSTIGMVHAFGHGSLGDLTAAVFSYRADSEGYTELLAGSGGVAVAQRTALTGTTGNDGQFTYSAHTDGRIYIENRLGGSRTVSLYVVGAPL